MHDGCPATHLAILLTLLPLQASYSPHWLRQTLTMGSLASIKHGLLIYALLNAFCYATQAQRVGSSELTCIPGRLDLWGDFQTVRIECGGQIDPGTVATADYNWKSLLTDKTHLRTTVMELDQLPDYITKEEERISLFGTFQRDNRNILTCQTKRRVSLIGNKAVTVAFDPTKVFGGVDPPVQPPSAPPPQHKYYDNEYYGKGYDEEEEDGYDNEDEDEYEDEYEDEGEYDAYSYDEHASYYSVQYDDWQDTDGEDAELAAWGDETRQCSPRAVTANSEGDQASVSAVKTQQTKRRPGNAVNRRRPPRRNTTRPAKPQKPTRATTRPGQPGTPARPTKPSRAVQTPHNLRVLVKCKSAPAGGANRGACIVRMRLTVRFSGGLNGSPLVATPRVSTAAVGVAQSDSSQAANNLVRDLGFTCRTVTFQDLLNNLDTLELNGGQGRAVDTGLCFRGDNVEPAADDTTMPAGAGYDENTLRKAVRFARYTAAIHGCIPGQTFGNGQTGTWADIAAWGGPTPSPQCPSCFKDGINFGDGLGGAPFGRQTPPFTEESNSYQDAGMVFTDLALDAEPAIVVLFRATVSAIGNGVQWLSNLGSCLLLAQIQLPIPDAAGQSNAAAGQVCNGWNSGPLDTLYDSLLANVKTRIAALTNGGASPARIYVIGHSRGGALAATFAARLLAEQQSGGLGAHSGSFGQRGQVSLYTFGAPRAGDNTFANFLEERIYERFRIVTRFDPVSYGPNEAQSNGVTYRHFHPLVLFRDPITNPTTLTSVKRCVLTPQEDMTADLQQCFASCNSALICSNVDVPQAVAVAGQRVPVNTACTGLLRERIGVDFNTLSSATGVFDHGTYMGIDVNNGQCSEDMSVYNAFTGGTNCLISSIVN